MNIFVAYKQNPDDGDVKPGSFELHEVRVPSVSQEYEVAFETEYYSRISVRWAGRTTYVIEPGYDEYGGFDEGNYRRIDEGDCLAQVAVCLGLCDSMEDYLQWLYANVDLVEIDGRAIFTGGGE